MQPEDAGLVADHDLVGLLRVVPVAGLQLVAADAELAAGADGHDVAVAVDDLGQGVRHQRANRGQTSVDRVVGEGVEARRRRLRQAVARRELGHAQLRHQLLHQVPRHRRPRDDAGPQPQVRRAQVLRLGQREQAVEHGGDAVQRGALLADHGAERCRRVEHLGRIDDLGAVGDDGHQAEYEAEAVEERGRTAEDVVWCEPHAVPDEAGVVYNIAMTQSQPGSLSPSLSAVVMVDAWKRTDE